MKRVLRGLANLAVGIAAAFLCWGASAQGYAPGDRVQASPLFMDSAWQDCEVVSIIDANSYRVLCAGYEYTVTKQWVRPAAAKAPASQGGGSSSGKPSQGSSPATAGAGASPSADPGEGLCKVGTRVVDREGRTGTVSQGGKVSCHVKLDDGSNDREYYLAWMLSPEGKGGGRTDGGGDLETGTYTCSAAVGIQGIFRLTINSSTKYTNDKGKSGSYALDAGTGKIVFESGQFAGNFGAKLGPGKFGISADQDGFMATVCTLD